MGMAASQARLLSITARLTNNENTGQAISYSKQRLADQTQQITNEYNDALEATKLTVLTGFNGAQANYTDISYNLMTGLQMAEETKQYVITDTKGRMLVTNDIAQAYEKSRGNFNTFLASVGAVNDSATSNKKYSQADITVQKNSTDEQAKKQTEQKIHEAWDKYFESVGIQVGDPEHQWDNFEFSWTETVNPETGEYAIGDGYAGYLRVETDKDGKIRYEQIEKTDEDGNVVYTDIPVLNDDETPVLDENGKPTYQPVLIDVPIYAHPQKFDENGEPVVDADGKPVLDDTAYIYDPINYEGTSQESRDLYDYAMAITEAYLRVNNDNGTADNGKKYELEYIMSDDTYASAADPNNKSALNYYRNIFDKIQQCGYFTYTDNASKAAQNEHYIYAADGTGNKGTVQKSPLKDNYTFEAALRDGSLRLEYYSTTDKKFKSTTISEDNCIQEVADERAIAKAETKYTQDMADLENKDNKLDLELKKLDTEHNALQTEYESVKSVVSKNVESSFKIFS